MARVQSIGYQVNQILKSHNGIGISKKEQRENSGLRAENGHKVSDLFHSYKSLDNARYDLTNLGRFAKENYNIKDMSKIDINIVKDWIKTRDISYNTASNNLSELNKVSEHFNFTKEQVKELRQELKQELRPQTLDSRAYKMEKLQEIQLNEKAQIAFELQRDYGLRVKEATHINLERQLKDNNTLIIQSKGGKLIEKQLTPQLIQRIKENAINGIYSIPKTTYSDNLKKEIEKNGMKWNGTHGIRHSFAQYKLDKENFSKAEVSREMGHVREEITNTYLR